MAGASSDVAWHFDYLRPLVLRRTEFVFRWRRRVRRPPVGRGRGADRLLGLPNTDGGDGGGGGGRRSFGILYLNARKTDFEPPQKGRECPSDKMKSTINFAIMNAGTALNFSPEFVKALIATLWESQVQNGPGTKDSGTAGEMEVDPPVTPPTQPNIEKLNRQQVQKLEELAKKAEKVVDLKQFLAHVNSLASDVFKSKSMLDHMADFIGPIEDDDDDGVDVNFHLRDYFVLIKTGRVYEMRNGVHVFVGMLGMNEFKGMVLPEIIE